MYNSIVTSASSEHYFRRRIAHMGISGEAENGRELTRFSLCARRALSIVICFEDVTRIALPQGQMVVNMSYEQVREMRKNVYMGRDENLILTPFVAQIVRPLGIVVLRIHRILSSRKRVWGGGNKNSESLILISC